MQARALRCALAIATATIAFGAHAGTATATCQVPPASSDPLSDRAGLLASYEQLPRQCLQQLFAACSEASNRAMLDFGSAATCSFSYEALLRQQFGGDFHALLAWWRSRREPDAD